MSVKHRTQPPTRSGDSRGMIGGILVLIGVVIAIAGIADSGDELGSGVAAVIGGFLVLLGVILIAGRSSS